MSDRLSDIARAENVRDAARALNTAIDKATEIGLRVDAEMLQRRQMGKADAPLVVIKSIARPV